MDYDKLHKKRVQQYLRRIEMLFDELVEAIVFKSAPIPLKDGLFQFKKYPKISRFVELSLLQFNKDLRQLLTTSTGDSWSLANQKNDALKQNTLKSVSKKIPDEVYKKLSEAPQPRNLEALKSFQDRKVGNFKISERVWSITQNTKKELEFALDVGMAEGKGARELAREVKKNLKEPDRLYRKVKDKHGNLTLSKNAKAYKPGQGVYRSSMANAVRLTKEENNQAYRMADHLRIMQNNDIVGYQVQLSNAHKIVDICDDLKGFYPKAFVWKGWHIGCMCQRFTVRKTDKEIIDEINKGINLPPESSQNYIADVPDQFKEYMEKNKEKMEKWKTQPFFVTDNKAFVK